MGSRGKGVKFPKLKLHIGRSMKSIKRQTERKKFKGKK